MSSPHSLARGHGLGWARTLMVAAWCATVAVGRLQGNLADLDISHQVGERPVSPGERGPVRRARGHAAGGLRPVHRLGVNKGLRISEGGRSGTTMLVRVVARAKGVWFPLAHGAGRSSPSSPVMVRPFHRLAQQMHGVRQGGYAGGRVRRGGK